MTAPLRCARMTSMENKIDKCINRIWAILYFSGGSHLRTVYSGGVSDRATITVGSTLNLFTLRTGLTEAYESVGDRPWLIKLTSI